MKVHCSHDQLVPISELKLDPNNRNIHPPEQIARLAEILKYQGWRYPVKVSSQSGLVRSGHGRIEAAILNKWDMVPVNYQDYESLDQEYADSIADNAIASWAELNISAIQKDLEILGNLNIEMLGIRDFQIIGDEKLPSGCDEDEVTENVEPKTKLGDIYILGNHRLMCGDSTSIDAVEKLMNGEKSDITFTSPPYNVGKTPNGNENKYLNYQDDRESEDYKQLLHDFTTNCLTVSEYVFSNIQSLSGNKIALIEYLYNLKEKYADTIIWDKETSEPAMARRVLNSQFEYIHIFSNEAKRTVGKRDFRGTLTNVFRLNSRAGKEYAKLHKATFRVELPQFFIENFTESSCLDPFGGTGTTLIACEKTQRKCFMMELDPHYCDMIVARWEKYTGKKAELLNG